MQHKEAQKAARNREIFGSLQMHRSSQILAGRPQQRSCQQSDSCSADALLAAAEEGWQQAVASPEALLAAGVWALSSALVVAARLDVPLQRQTAWGLAPWSTCVGLPPP